MKGMKISALIMACMFIVGSAFGQNRFQKDPLFPDPQAGGGTQVFLGIAEFFAAYKPNETTTKASSDIAKAETYLTTMRRLPETTESYYHIIHRSSDSDLVPIALGKGGPFTAAEKAAMITKAEEGLVAAQERYLRELQATPLGAKIIRYIRKVGAAVFVADSAGRVYVWNALGADPGFSPGIVWIKSLIN